MFQPRAFRPRGTVRPGSAPDQHPVRRFVVARVAHRPPSDDGMSTAEYAIGTIAAAAFAALLYTIVTGDSVLAALTTLVQKALSVSF